MKHQQSAGGQIARPDEEALRVLARKASFREDQRKMDQKGGRGDKGGGLGPVNFPIEGIQLARVMKGAKDKRGQAEQIKVDRAPSVPATDENEEADEEVEQADDAQVILERERLRSGRRDHGCIENATLAADLITGARPDAESPEALDDVDGARHRLTVDGNKHIAGFYSGALTWGGRGYYSRVNSLRTVEPGDAIVGNVEGKALLEIHDSENSDSDRKQHKYQGTQLGPDCLVVADHKWRSRSVSLCRKRVARSVPCHMKFRGS